MASSGADGGGLRIPQMKGWKERMSTNRGPMQEICYAVVKFECSQPGKVNVRVLRASSLVKHIDWPSSYKQQLLSYFSVSLHFLLCLEEPAARGHLQQHRALTAPCNTVEVHVHAKLIFVQMVFLTALLGNAMNASKQVRTILTALAESQLDLLSRIMPQHAIEFLATESSEAIPEHVGQLARAHKGVTLLFMDIVGFTSMSKDWRKALGKGCSSMVYDALHLAACFLVPLLPVRSTTASNQLHVFCWGQQAAPPSAPLLSNYFFLSASPSAQNVKPVEAY
eukprot:1142264-Pelagomonas_calceolata.AAC.6